MSIKVYVASLAKYNSGRLVGVWIDLPSDDLWEQVEEMLAGDEDSDLDLVALVDEKTPELEEALDDIAYKVMWEHDFKPLISLKVFSEERFRESLAKGNSYYRNVELEGIVV